MEDPATVVNDAPALQRTSFLRAFHPAGPWVLSAIHPEPPKQIETRTFMPDEADDAETWIERHNVDRNIYFSVNLPNRRLSKKASKTDIHSVPWLHVDIDARALNPSELEIEGRAAQHLAQEIDRIRLLVTERCPTLPPTVIIFSGGGYQVFWKLEKPIETGGRLEAAEEVARYNRQLLNILDGDTSAPNADRIMRLPGTTNWPDEKKRKRGRVVAQAEVYSFDPTRVYPLSRFQSAPAPKTAGVHAGGIPQLDTSNIVRLANVDELDKWKVPDRVKLIIVQGEDADNPKDGDNSRSAWLFDVLCQMARADVPDNVMFSVITDPDFKISESVLEKAPNHEKYAARQIQHAREEVEDPDLREMNEKHCVILDYGGQVRVATVRWDCVHKRNSLSVQRPAEFFARYAHVSKKVGKTDLNRGKWWFQHPLRRQKEALVYLPGEDTPNDLNLWQGFAVESRAGTKHESFLAHIRDIICAGIVAHHIYLISWMARAVQRPDLVGTTAIVLCGGRGTGKSFFAKHFGWLWGPHFIQVTDPKHLVGSSFNAHLFQCSVLFADEAYCTGDVRHEGTLKAVVTEEMNMIERKGVDAQPARNVVHLILASNGDWVVPAGPHERRFFVLDVSDARQQDNAYFGSIAADLEDGGYENLLHYLLNYDLSDFDVRKVPWTESLSDQIERGLSPAEELIHEALQTGQLPRWDMTDANGRVRVAARDFVPLAIRDRDPIGALRMSKSIGRTLSKIADPDKAQRTTGRRRHWLPKLGEARVRWKSRFGFEVTGPAGSWAHQGTEEPDGEPLEDPAGTVLPFP